MSKSLNLFCRGLNILGVFLSNLLLLTFFSLKLFTNPILLLIIMD